MASAGKPHVVCFPYPEQGHIIPMLKLAKLLHFRGFYITFLNTEFNHQRLLRSRGRDSLLGLDDFRFETIPDGRAPEEQDHLSLTKSMAKNSLVLFRGFMDKMINDNSPEVPRVTCIVADGLLTSTLTVAEELRVPEVLFWPTSASCLMGHYHFKELIERGVIPLKDETDLTNGYLDTCIDWIPGMKDIQLRDLPTFARTTDLNDFPLNFVTEESQRSFNASAIVFNTFDDLELEVLDAIKYKFSRIYTIGPLSLLSQHESDDRLNSIGGNLWKEETECFEWLDKQEPKSIVYVNFGSVTVLTDQQLQEFAWGLANSKHPFFWVIRSNLLIDDSTVSEEFIKETMGRGFLSSWCPQEKVLSHPSIGGFLTHSGWNSTLESICGGVPMICWPFIYDQTTNCHYVCKKWSIGMEIDNDVKRDEVEGLIRELMEGEKGKEMRNNAMRWKMKAEEATKEGGSSYVNMDKLIKEVMLCPRKN